MDQELDGHVNGSGCMQKWDQSLCKSGLHAKVGCKSGPHAKVRSQNYVHAKVGCKSGMQKWASPVNTTLIRDPCTRPLHV